MSTALNQMNTFFSNFFSTECPQEKSFLLICRTNCLKSLAISTGTQKVKKSRMFAQKKTKERRKEKEILTTETDLCRISFCFFYNYV